jgi:hypothetical protein
VHVQNVGVQQRNVRVQQRNVRVQLQKPAYSSKPCGLFRILTVASARW